MRLNFPNLRNAALTVATLIVPLATVSTVRAEDHRYHDAKNNDEHQWNDHEDKAYRIWAKENHRKYKDFGKLKEEDRQAYWAWRHDHSDALLKIDIR